MLVVDKPIESKSEDFLDRKYFAKNIANAIVNYSDKDNSSLTIGLYGKWGSGKTSIINMITENIDDIILFKYEPWIFSDTEQLISNFFKEFAKAIKHKDYAEEAKKIGEELETYASFFEPLSLIPEPTVSLLGLASAKVFGSVGKVSKKWGQLKSKNLSTTKLSIENHLQKLDKKILIIIDDIDRLNNTEIRQIFQMIKVLGNFPNTIYLSSMDREVVVEALAEVQKGDGSEYLEKIINVPFVVPSISKEDVQKFLFMELDKIIEDADFDENYWENIYHSGFKNFFSNIRDVVRYINIFQFNYGVLKNKVNVVDLIASSALQVFEPKIFESMKLNKDIFVGTIPESQYGGSEAEDKVKEFIEKSFKNLQVLSQEVYLDFLKELFVKINEVYSNTHYVGATSICRKDAKICSAEYFDTYFTMLLSDKTLSSFEMKSIIKDLSNEDKFVEKIQFLNKENKIADFLKKLQDFTQSDIKKEDFQVLVNVLMDMGDTFPNEDEGMFSSGNSMQIMRIFYQLLKRIDNKKERFEILRTAMKRAENSINTLSTRISIYMQEHGEYDDNAKPESQLTIEKEDLLELKQLLLSKIEQWISKYSLLQHEKGLNILYVWLKLDEQKSKEYIAKKIQEDDKLIDFLKLFISYTYSQTSEDYTTRKNINYNYDGIVQFIEIDKITDRVNKLNIADYEDGLTLYAIENFLTHCNGASIVNED